MSAASWLRNLRSYLLPGPKARQASPTTRPVRSCLHLEQLEDRVVPAVAGANVLGGVNNPTFQFGPATAFVNVSQHNLSGVDNSQRLTLDIIGAGSGVLDQFILGFGSTASVNSLGTTSSVNSLGTSNPLVPSFAPEAFGFGSGTQPGAPWAPAAYNVGLANRQMGYPSISDHGFQAPPPWASNTAFRILHDDGRIADDKTEEVNGSAQPLDRVLTEKQADSGRPWDTNSDEAQTGEDGVVGVQPIGSEVVRADGLRDRQGQDVLRMADGSPADLAYIEGRNGTVAGRRGDAEVEEYLFGGHLPRQLSDETDHDSSHAALFTLGENPLLATLEGTSEEWTTVQERMTESPLLLGAILGLVSLPIHSTAQEQEEDTEDIEEERED